MIVFEEVGFGYRAGEPVVCGLTAGLKPGAVTAVIGPNGAGKSTVLKLMLGLLGPTKGRVIWGDGQEGSGPKTLCQTAEPLRAQRLAYVPQHGSVAFGFSVEQVVAMGAMGAAGAMASSAPEALQMALDRLDLEAVRERPFEQLSGGQQQRVVMARALLQRDTGLAGGGVILDEPVSAMDLKHAHRAMRTLKSRAENGEMVVVVLHDLTLAARYADQVWLLEAGRLLAAGPVADVMQPERLSPVYGVPLEVMIDAQGRRIFGVGGDL